MAKINLNPPAMVVHPTPLDVAACTRELHEELNPEQHRAVHWGEGPVVLAATAGCLAGTTTIEVNRAGKSFRCRIDELVAKFNGGPRIISTSPRAEKARRSAAPRPSWNTSIPTTIRARDQDGFIRLFPLAAAVYSGMKPLLEVHTVGSRSIRATADHQFLTADGWRRLGEMPVGTLVYVDGGLQPREARSSKKNQYQFIFGLANHPYSSYRGKGNYTVPTHRVVMEAALSGLSPVRFISAVRACAPGLVFLDPERFHVHHLDEDPQNNRLTNLTILTVREHGTAHGQAGGWQRVTARTVLDRITSIATCGFAQTYDLALGTEPHNFLADGFVVHNSGKTKVVTLRVEQLIRNGADPSRIGAFTFGNDAAKEIEERLHKLGVIAKVSTLHSLSYEILRTDGDRWGGSFKVDDKNVLHIVLKEIVTRTLKANDVDVTDVQACIGLAKAAGLSMHPDLALENEGEVHQFFQAHAKKHWRAGTYVDAYRLLEEQRITRGLIDFDDMLVLGYLTLLKDEGILAKWQGAFDYLIVDEGQDSSFVQNWVALNLARPRDNIMLVGDIQQSLYRWRGAMPDEFVDFAKKFSLLRLPTNYRSTQEICAAATKLTHDQDWNVTGPTHHHAAAASDPDSAIAVEYGSPDDEARSIAVKIQALHADGVRFGDIAVLYRVTSLLVPVEDAFLKAQIPYRVWSGVNFYERKEVKDLLAYLRVAALRDPTEEWVRRTVNAPFRYLGKAYVENVSAFAQQEGIAFLDALTRFDPPRESQRRAANELYNIHKSTNALIADKKGAGTVLGHILDVTRYIGFLKKEEGDETPDPDGGRVAHVHQLLRVAEAFPTVGSFLDYVELMNAALKEARHKKAEDVVAMSSIHRFKGLERKHIFGVGWVDGILPHAANSDQGEELRLAFVCLTRAREKFEASWPRTEVSARGVLEVRPSPFIAKAGFPVKRQHPEQK